MLKEVPLDSQESEDRTIVIHRFFSSLSQAVNIFVVELPSLVVGMGGFTAVLLSHRVPWQVFVAVGIFVAIPTGSHWILKRNQAFKRALEKESQEIQALGQIFADRHDPLIQSALERYRTTISEEAMRLRRRANNGTLVHVSSRATLRALIGVAAMWAIPSVTPEVATLLVMFAITFGGHLSSLYYFAEFFHKVNTDAAGLLELSNEPKKPPLPGSDQLTLADIQIVDLQVDYPAKSNNTITVAIGDLLIEGAKQRCLRQKMVQVRLPWRRFSAEGNRLIEVQYSAGGTRLVSLTRVTA